MDSVLEVLNMVLEYEVIIYSSSTHLPWYAEYACSRRAAQGAAAIPGSPGDDRAKKSQGAADQRRGDIKVHKDGKTGYWT